MEEAYQKSRVGSSDWEAFIETIGWSSSSRASVRVARVLAPRIAFVMSLRAVLSWNAVK